MELLNELPKNVVDLILKTRNSEFATVSKAGLPIDTPMLIFPSPGMKTFDVCTGVSYPTKAERARANPKVGLLFEGGANEPVVAIGGMARVSDSDIQSNLNRYLAETAYARPYNPPWEIAKKAVFYWARILVAITPTKILWWDKPSDMDKAPHAWNAPADTVYPASDPKPGGTPSKAYNAAKDVSWQDLAASALRLQMPAHITRCDADGFPLPIRGAAVTQTAEGFTFDLPAGAPWDRRGEATLTFMGRETFVGPIEPTSGNGMKMTVERALPVHPFMNDPHEMWNPSEEIHRAMYGRLEHELARRGQPVPKVPDEEPPLTEYAKIRKAAVAEDFEGAVPVE
jgi:hypothetical protein